MTAKDHSTSNSPNSQDTDASIVAMLDEILANDDLYIMTGGSDFHLCTSKTDVNDWKYYETIDTYETRAAAYRAGIDCMIELSIEGWERGGAE